MGRPWRVELADGYYHVLSRGNERRAVFFDDADRERFVALLGLMAERFELWACGLGCQIFKYQLSLDPGPLRA